MLDTSAITTSCGSNYDNSNQDLSELNELAMFDLENQLVEAKPIINNRQPCNLKRSTFQIDNDCSDYGADLYNSDPTNTTRRSTRNRNKKTKIDSDPLDLAYDNNTNSSSNFGSKRFSNKDAATKYRMKKLNEKDKLFETKTILEKENDDVKKKIDHVQTEVDYLKNLLVQMLLTKGILNTKAGF